MVIRIVTLVVALLVLAAPADAAIAELDTGAEAAITADELVVELARPALPARAPVHLAPPHRDPPPPPAPTLAGVFRPPRPASFV